MFVSWACKRFCQLRARPFSHLRDARGGATAALGRGVGEGAATAARLREGRETVVGARVARQRAQVRRRADHVVAVEKVVDVQQGHLPAIAAVQAGVDWLRPTRHHGDPVRTQRPLCGPSSAIQTAQQQHGRSSTLGRHLRRSESHPETSPPVESGHPGRFRSRSARAGSSAGSDNDLQRNQHRMKFASEKQPVNLVDVA